MQGRFDVNEEIANAIAAFMVLAALYFVADGASWTLWQTMISALVSYAAVRST